MHIPAKVILIYASLVSIFIALTGLISAQSYESLILQLLFIPLPLYFVHELGKALTHKNGAISLRKKRKEVLFSAIIFTILLIVSLQRVLQPTEDEFLDDTPSAQGQGIIFTTE